MVMVSLYSASDAPAAVVAAEPEAALAAVVLLEEPEFPQAARAETVRTAAAASARIY